MLSKMVIDRQISARAVQQAAETHAPLLQQSLEQNLQPLLEPGEQLPDLAFFLRLQGRQLGASSDRLVDADEAHAAELADDEPIRQAREGRVVQVRSLLIENKEIVTGVFGSQALALLGLNGTLPSDPVRLVRVARTVAENLRTKTLPEPRLGVVFDAAPRADRLEQLAAELEQADLDLVREKKEAASTLRDKDQVLADHDHLFGRVATVVSALLRLVDEDRLAERVRPSTRRPGLTREEAGEVAEAEKQP